MKTEKEVREDIKNCIENNKHILNCYPATIEINSPRALMQMSACIQLAVLYDMLGEKRPKFKCDEWDKKNQ
jgi:hypothetical protein